MRSASSSHDDDDDDDMLVMIVVIMIVLTVMKIIIHDWGCLFVCSIFMPDNVDKNVVFDNDHNLDDDHEAFKTQNLFFLLPSR